MTTKARSTIEDLYHIPEDGKAELVNGEIICIPPTGELPGRAGGSVYVSLRAYEGKAPGRASPDNVGFRVYLPNRESFSPDTARYIVPSAGMKFLEGAPLFAVEIRSDGDYGPTAERRIAEKRKDYFAAGTLVVWDVDLNSPEAVRSYGAANPDSPKVFRQNEMADAEPAVPGWRFAVNELFK
ncbi:MAG TPA: Uma2 family endonuclease [Blastocatellia bacterium]|nr:Uma2 family endonuclease [Blastocatellia bacterium]